ncbi:hypothetical protein HMI54_014164 [Coelomomyces lativittatus]|nr:hypothetical protein HMI56_003168 [Coelomomyces lativittatus]KAJ1514267.1 hypothetical protein HMI55_004822 [Coelomomyces lativittatus]KAJ1514457.1 hypothetical protein HMI54_014164 [Coelomomyces lativittatus]
MTSFNSFFIKNTSLDHSNLHWVPTPSVSLPSHLGSDGYHWGSTELMNNPTPTSHEVDPPYSRSDMFRHFLIENSDLLYDLASPHTFDSLNEFWLEKIVSQSSSDPYFDARISFPTYHEHDMSTSKKFSLLQISNLDDKNIYNPAWSPLPLLENPYYPFLDSLIPVTYTDLIATALFSDPTRSMTLQSISTYLATHFFHTPRLLGGQLRSMYHALITDRCFRKLEDSSGTWTLYEPWYQLSKQESKDKLRYFNEAGLWKDVNATSWSINKVSHVFEKEKDSLQRIDSANTETEDRKRSMECNSVESKKLKRSTTEDSLSSLTSFSSELDLDSTFLVRGRENGQYGRFQSETALGDPSDDFFSKYIDSNYFDTSEEEDNEQDLSTVTSSL